MPEHTVIETTEKPSLLSNILAIIGLIILVIIIVWGLVHLAQLSSGWFSSLFSGSKSTPTIQISAQSDVTSGTATIVSWSYSTTATGTYAYLYQCQQGVQFALINTANNTANGIACGSAVPVTPSNSSIAVVPLLSATTSASVPFSIIFTSFAGAQVQGTATMIIHPSSTQTPSQVTQPTTQPVTTPTKPVVSKPVPVYSAPRTPTDLAVRIVSASVDQYGNGIVTFDIANIGGSTSGTYYFSAQMPTRVPTPYTSSLQAPLTPGSHILDTLRFSQAMTGTFSVAVGARDINQSNDYTSIWVNAPANYNYNYNAYNNYNSYNVQYQTGAY